MSGEAKAAMGGNRRQRTATTPTVAAHCRPLPPLFSPPITPPPDLAAHVVAHQQRAIRKNQLTNRPPPSRAIGKLPAGDEVVHTDRALTARIHVNPHALAPARHTAVPRPGQGHD